MNVTVLYVGSSLLAPLKHAEQEINRQYQLDLQIVGYNFGAPLSVNEWRRIEADISGSDVIFIIHVMDGENATRLLSILEEKNSRNHAVIVINCMPELMRYIRLGRLDVNGIFADSKMKEGKSGAARRTGQAIKLFESIGSWVGRQARSDKKKNGHRHTQYLRMVDRLPGVLRFVPNAGTLRDVKSYLYIFCYFLQPTPTNVRSMVLYALKHYVPDKRVRAARIKIPPPERVPSVAIYHPDAQKLFESFDEYEKWYRRRLRKRLLDPASTIGLLLMRPQVVSKTTQHYDQLIRAIEAEGLSVIPALSTLMDNREASQKFFRNPATEQSSSRVSQILSLTGFSFVGGPAMNDSGAASDFLEQMNVPYRSAVSLDMQTIEAWRESQVGLNPVQAGMQIAIPEIDGATEPFIYGGIPSLGLEPVALDERCARLARRMKQWNRLRTAPRGEVKIALTLFCFPPNKGNVGTAADLDVFPSVWRTLQSLKSEGYKVDLPSSVEVLRNDVLGGNGEKFGANTNVAYYMTPDEYRANCPYVHEIEKEWGAAPGQINSFGGNLLIQGLHLGNVFLGIQPTFGYEGDPMRLMMARSGAPHHGFMGFYVYLSKIFRADALIHVGTHGALEFMPGKQLGLSSECWPDRLIGELPHIYLYSVNNPSEGSIAKRRSYAELISYLTPPIENAGLYKELASLKDLLNTYRRSSDEVERARLFELIAETSSSLNLPTSRVTS
jgi:magnesium chelatase subunit H